MTYDTLADLLISKGVKFAYSLDGGGSAETVIGNRQINPIYENAEGRPVPTVLYFTLDGYPDVPSPYMFTVIKGAFDCNQLVYNYGFTTRACLNPNMFVVGSDMTINVTVPNGYYCGVSTFKSEYDNPDFYVTEGITEYHTGEVVMVSDFGWKVGSFSLDMGDADVIGFNFKRSDNGTITTDDITAITNGFFFEIGNSNVESNGVTVPNTGWVCGHSTSAVNVDGIYKGSIYSGNTRAAYVSNTGDVSLLYDYKPSTYYPVLIPDGCTYVSVNCQGYTFGVNEYKLVDGVWIRVKDSGWLSADKGDYIFQSETEAITVNVKVGSAGSEVITSVPDTVTVKFY